MGIKQQITEAVIKAMKEGDKLKLSCLRMILSSIKYKEIELRNKELPDEEILKVLSTRSKQGKEAIDQFRKGERADLAEKEEKELKIISSFMPEPLSEEEILNIVKKTAEETSAKTPADMGKLMKAVMAYLKGRADGRVVQEIIKKALS